MKLRHILPAVMTIAVLISCKNTETAEKITDSEENVVDATQIEVDNTDVEKRYATAEFIVECHLKQVVRLQSKKISKTLKV